jgi:hypothetical protein
MAIRASDYDQTRFLKAADVPTPRRFRIKDVTEEVMEPDKEKRLVVWFTNDKRGLVVNKTNNRILRGAFGDLVDGWKGQIVVVFSEMKNNGKMGLSVRIPPPKQATAAPQPSAPQPQSGNGAAGAVTVKAETPTPPAQQTVPVVPVVNDPELEPDPTTSLSDDLNDELPW